MHRCKLKQTPPMSTRKRRDPILNEPSFPHALGASIIVEYEGSPWPAKVHRVAVDQRSCTVKYAIDGSMEPSVSPSRINQHPHGVAPLEVIPEATEPTAAPLEVISEQVMVPMEDPTFTKKTSIAALNRFFSKLMKARLKRLKHKCKWCCCHRLDMPYFAAIPTESGSLRLKFVHATVSMTHECNLSDLDSTNLIKAVDSYLYLKGELLNEAHRISKSE